MYAALFFPSPWFFPLGFPCKVFNEVASYALYEIFFYNIHPRESVMNYYVDVHVGP